MIPMPELGGWVKLHRGLLLSPVWQNAVAFRVYVSMLLQSGHKTRSCVENGTTVKLLAGQLLTSQTEIGEVTGYSRKVVRSALEFLAGQNAVTLCGQYGKAGSVFTVHLLPFMEKGECAPVSQGPEFGPETGPCENDENGRDKNEENSLRERAFSFSGVKSGAGSNVPTGPDTGPESGPVIINKDEEVKKIRNNPLPPFLKGAADSSDSSSFVLRLWRESCEAAGVQYIEDKKTVRGAEAIAGELLATGKADAETIRRGMKNLLVKKANDPKAQMYNLGTLCRSFSNFVTAKSSDASGDGAASETVYEWWTLHCATCNMMRIKKLPNNKPSPEGSPCETVGCRGRVTARPGAY